MFSEKYLYGFYLFHLGFVKVGAFSPVFGKFQCVHVQKKFQDLDFKIGNPDLFRNLIQFSENMLRSSFFMDHSRVLPGAEFLPGIPAECFVCAEGAV